MSDAVPENEFTITIEQIKDYQFRVEFDKTNFQNLEMDEPPPLGHDSAPNASRILAAAIGNCLSASLLFCASKSRVALGPIRTKVHVQIARNERGRLRVGKIHVEIDPNIPEQEKHKAIRCLDLFEDYCVVTESVRQGIEVDVTVKGFPEI